MGVKLVKLNKQTQEPAIPASNNSSQRIRLVSSGGNVVPERGFTVGAPAPVSNNKNTALTRSGMDRDTFDANVRNRYAVKQDAAKDARLWNILTGAVKNVGAGVTNIGGTAVEGMGHLETAIQSQKDSEEISKLKEHNANYTQMLKSGKKLDGTQVTEAERKIFENAIRKNEYKLQSIPGYTKQQEARTMDVANSAYDKADELQRKSDIDVSAAKDGLGNVGSFLVDVGVAGTQMAGDAAAAALTGGSALVPMAIRSLGSGMQQARQGGASFGQQALYGVGNAAIQVGTEKMFNIATPFKKMFGAGVLDKALTGVAGKLSGTAVGKAALSTLGEASEEIVADILDPILQRATYNKDASFDLEQALYDGLVGGALGLVGSVGDVSRMRRANAAVASRESQGEAKAENTQNVTPQVQAAQSAIKTEVNGSKNITFGNTVNGAGNVDTISKNSYNNINETISNGGGAADGKSGANKLDGTSGEGLVPAWIRVNGQGGESGRGSGQGDIRTSGELRVTETPDKAYFSKALTDARESDLNNGWAVTPKSEEELSGCKLLLSDDGTAGVAVASGGDIEAVFRNKLNGKKGSMNTIIPEAIANGGSKLDCYGDGLVRLYERFGFKPVCRVEFNPKYANPGWDVSKGTPYIYFMMATDTDANSVRSKLGGYKFSEQSERDALPTFGKNDYDKAFEYRDNLLKGTNGLENGDTPGDSSLNHILSQTQDGDLGAANADKPGSVGAKTAEFPVKQVRNQTHATDNAMTENEKVKSGLTPEQRTHQVLTDAESVAKAKERLEFDYDFEVKDLSERDNWDAVDRDMSQQVLRDKVDAARQSGDWSEVAKWQKLIDERNTQSGQMLHANRKYAMAPESIVADAAKTLEHNKRLNPPAKARVMDHVAEQAEKFNLAKDKGSLIALVKENSTIRKTNGLFGNKLSKSIEAALDADSEEHLREVAATQIKSIASDYNGASVWQKVRSIRVMNMLSNLATVNRNLTGNSVTDPMDAISGNIGVLVDKALSAKTGTRSLPVDKSWFSREKRRGAMDGAIKSYIEVALDATVDDSKTRYDQSRGRTFKMTGGAFERFLSTWSKYQGYALNTTDEFQKGGIQAETQRGIDELKRAKKIKDDSLDNAAVEESKYRTFQNDSKLAKTMVDLHNALNNIGVGDRVENNGNLTQSTKEFGLGDLVTPFARVPANLVSVDLDYSSVGAVKSLVQIGNVLAKAHNGTLTAEQQAKAVKSFGRAANGIAITAGFAALALNGIIRVADDDEDKDVAYVNKSIGESNTQFNVSAMNRWFNGESTEWQDGDTVVSVGFLQPLNAMMTTGALIAEDVRSGDVSLGSILKDSFTGTFEALFDLPCMSSLESIYNGFRYSDAKTSGGRAADAAYSFAADQVSSSLVPNAVRSLARGTDNNYRDAYSSNSTAVQALDAVRSSLPGLRQTLPKSLDSFGKEKTYTGDWLMNLLNATTLPGSITQLNKTPVTNELESVYKKTGQSNIYPDRYAPESVDRTVDGVKETIALNAEEQRTYQITRGQTTEKAMSALLDSSVYQKLDAEHRADALTLAKQYANDVAKKEVFGKKYKSDWDKAREYAGKNEKKLSDYLLYKTVTSGKDKNTDKVRAAVQAGLKDDVILFHMSDSANEGYSDAKAAGIKIEDFADAWYYLGSVKADKDKNGDPISGSSKKKGASYINRLKLTPEQKDVLYLQNYSREGLYAQPWHRDKLTGFLIRS